MKLNNPQPSLKYALAMLAAMLVFVRGAEAASKYKILHEFLDKPARDPAAVLVADPAGNLYGTTRYSDDGGCYFGLGCGVVFKLARRSDGHWDYTVIHRFKGPDGEQPTTGLIRDSSGNLYGTTVLGGANSVGTVFEVSPAGAGWKEKVLYSFGGSGDLNNPGGGLTLEASGNLYGPAQYGGKLGRGGVFELKPSGKGWQETILYSFPGGADGETPFAKLARDSAGNLYGMAVGSKYGTSGGVVFELTPSSGGTWAETVLHSFDNSGQMSWGVIFDSAGNLYGTTGSGIAFEISPSTDKWTFKVLRRFNGPIYAGLTIDPAGNLYGEMFSGGAGYGVVFELSQSGGKWKETVLHSFDLNDGAFPVGGLVFGQGGLLYGTTYGGGIQSGVAFSVTP
jgi:uncharacterized repeat protein (TIGR03803 family)